MPLITISSPTTQAGRNRNGRKDQQVWCDKYDDSPLHHLVLATLLFLQVCWQIIFKNRSSTPCLLTDLDWSSWAPATAAQGFGRRFVHTKCGVCVTFEASPRSKRHEHGRRDLACERECLDIDLLPRMETLSYRLVAIDGYRWLWLGGSLSSRSTSRVSDIFWLLKAMAHEWCHFRATDLGAGRSLFGNRIIIIITIWRSNTATSWSHAQISVMTLSISTTVNISAPTRPAPFSCFLKHPTSIALTAVNRFAEITALSCAFVTSTITNPKYV